MKAVKKVVWWVATIGLLVTGVTSLLLLKAIEWADPFDECECDDSMHDQAPAS
jgi:hypothetical protein